MIKCVRCHREATMVSPNDLCDLHWLLWFQEGWYTAKKDTPKRAIRAFRQQLKDGWRRHGRPKDWRSQWLDVNAYVWILTGDWAGYPHESVQGAPRAHEDGPRNDEMARRVCRHHLDINAHIGGPKGLLENET